MIRWLTLTLGFALAVSAPRETGAQEASAGLVYDLESGSPVSGALIGRRMPGSKSSADWLEVDLRGRFAVPRGWAGSSIEVRALGHKTLVLPLEQAEAAAWRIGLEADPLELESLVVTASGRTQRSAEVAVPVTRVSAAEIRVAGATSAHALLAEIPGLQSVGNVPVGSNIMIRGIGDSRVLVLLDGQPAGGALLENRDLSRMSLAGVERVEVVKGPLSSRYGSDALGGVINIITRDPEPGLDGEARLMTGGQGRSEADASLSGGGDFRYRVTGSWRQEDQVPGLDRSLDVFARVWDVRSSARYDAGGRVRARADFSFLRERQRWPVGGGFSGFNDNRGLTGWIEAAVDIGPGSWVVRTFGQDYRHLYRSARGSAPIAGSDDLQEERVWKGMLGYSLELGAHALDVGLESSRRTITSPDKILEDRASDDQVEAFLQDAWAIGGATLTGGARLTLNDRWGNTISPSFGIATPVSAALRLRGTMGRGFRAPSFKELAWDFANVGAGYTVQGNSDLEPETSWSASVGMDWAPTAVWRVTADAYTNEIDDLIEFAFVGNNPSGLLVYSPRNFARARTRGFELGTSYRAGSGRAQAEYSFLDARSLDDDVSLDRRARHSGRVRVGADLDLLQGVAIDLTAHVTGDAPIVGEDAQGQAAVVGKQEALFSLDGLLAVDVPFGLRALFGVDNLFNARPEGWQAVVGRRFRVGLEARDLF